MRVFGFFCVCRRLRHDLPPELTSEVVGDFSRDVTIADQEIFPAIVVQVDEIGPPTPASHVDASGGRLFLKLLPIHIEVKTESFKSEISK